MMPGSINMPPCPSGDNQTRVSSRATGQIHTKRSEKPFSKRLGNFIRKFEKLVGQQVP